MSKVIFEKHSEHIAVITLNSPENLNALSTEFMAEIDAAVDQAAADQTVYVLIITGTGKSFIAGANIKEMIDYNSLKMLEWARLGSDLNTKIENLRFPVIAAVNGFALGGGCELAMACDFRIASEKARFGQPEVGIGITPGAGGTQRLPRLVGEGIAKELLYTGKTITAAEAERIGLVNRTVAHETLMDEVIKVAQVISAQAQIAVQQCKRAVNVGMQTDLKSALALEHQIVSFCFDTEDKRIGMSAFLNKENEKHFIYR